MSQEKENNRQRKSGKRRVIHLFHIYTIFDPVIVLINYCNERIRLSPLCCIIKWPLNRNRRSRTAPQAAGIYLATCINWSFGTVLSSQRTVCVMHISHHTHLSIYLKNVQLNQFFSQENNNKTVLFLGHNFFPSFPPFGLL